MAPRRPTPGPKRLRPTENRGGTEDPVGAVVGAAGGSDSASIDPRAQAASSDAQLEPVLSSPAPEPAAPSSSPQVCAGGATPSTLVSANEIGDIALSATHLYWAAYNGIHRIPKQGGSDQIVTSSTGSALRSAGNLLYWVEPGSTLFSMPSDGSAPPLQLVDDLATPLAWAATESSVYYMAESTNVGGECAGNRLKVVPSQGGDAVVLAEVANNVDQLAVDATGVYWAETFGCTPTSTQIDKYTFATASVSPFARTTGVPHSLRASGGRLLWLNEGGVWSQAVDGGDPILLADPPLVRGLATNGTTAYWAASIPNGDKADIFSAPLAGGEPHTVACQVFGIDEFWFFADESSLYYRSFELDMIGRLATSGRADAGAGVSADAGVGGADSP